MLENNVKKVYVWCGCGYFLDEIIITPDEYNDYDDISIEEVAYRCIKENKGYFKTYNDVENEAKQEIAALNNIEIDDVEQYEIDKYIDEYYHENECCCYCDLSAYDMENGFLLIENLRVENIEVYY